MKLIDIVKVDITIKKIINSIDDFSLKFKMLSILKNIESTILSYEEIKNELIMKYGTKNEETNSYIVPNDCEEFKKEFQCFIDSDVEIELQKIDFSSINSLNLDVNDLLMLYPIIGNDNE